MNIYVQTSLVSLIGLGLSVLSVIRNLTNKAKLANVIFDWGLFFKSDLIFQVLGSLLTTGLALMFLEPVLEKYPSLIHNVIAILVIFATIGYTGSDLASRFFSTVNSRINAAIDSKTTAADLASGNLGAPTPASKPGVPPPVNSKLDT